MTRLSAFASVLAALIASGAVAQQMAPEQAREEGRALARAARADEALIPSAERQAQAVPGYQGPTTPQSTYFDDPDRLITDGGAIARSNDAYRTATDQARTRPAFDNADILAVTARATAVENDPGAYLGGEVVGATSGSCTPLPPSTSTSSYYEASCNSGTRVDETTPVCRVPLVVDVRDEDRWRYSCVTEHGRGNRQASLCTAFDASVSTGSCREIDRHSIGGGCLQGVGAHCTEPGDPADEITYSCSVQVPGQTGTLVQERTVVGERRDEATCQTETADATCELQAETCVDAAPATRDVGGLAVTRACWQWERTYACHRYSPASDCAVLEGNGQCSYLRTDCLDDPPSGPCRVSEQVYRCPVPEAQTSGDKQYICGNDVYCLNGECEPIEREASTEFKDALVALHSIDQAGREFDPDNFTVFSGTRDTCHKPVFGLVNCCAGKTSGLLTAAAGGAAIAGGPAAVAALATPFLSLFLCSQDEMRLDIKDRMGFCHRVGTYCSSSVLGICQTKRTAFCCFESKLSRILQEQGRPQIGKAWDVPKRETCRGLTVDEFARLDLSRMDFTEVYAEFLDAAKLPDEVQAMGDIQQKIRSYYDLHRG